LCSSLGVLLMRKHSLCITWIDRRLVSALCWGVPLYTTWIREWYYILIIKNDNLMFCFFFCAQIPGRDWCCFPRFRSTASRIEVRPLVIHLTSWLNCSNVMLL
jgi:hypothetical protein